MRPRSKLTRLITCGTILGQSIILAAGVLEWQARAIVDTRGKPDTRCELIAEASSQRISLVLRVGKVAAGLTQRSANVVAEEQSSRDRIPDIPHHVGVADKAGKLSEPNQSELPFRAIDDRLVEGNWIADTCIQQLVIVRVVPHIPSVEV